MRYGRVTQCRCVFSSVSSVPSQEEEEKEHQAEEEEKERERDGSDVARSLNSSPSSVESSSKILHHQESNLTVRLRLST